jgi:hypothetical protein
VFESFSITEAQSLVRPEFLLRTPDTPYVTSLGAQERCLCVFRERVFEWLYMHRFVCAAYIESGGRSCFGAAAISN